MHLLPIAYRDHLLFCHIKYFIFAYALVPSIQDIYDYSTYKNLLLIAALCWALRGREQNMALPQPCGSSTSDWALEWTARARRRGRKQGGVRNLRVYLHDWFVSPDPQCTVLARRPLLACSSTVPLSSLETIDNCSCESSLLSFLSLAWMFKGLGGIL